MDITDLVYIDETGYHFSDYPTFLTWIQDEYRTIYGADVYLEADSQDGQFLAILAKAFYDTAALGSSVFNSFSPATAQGVGLSRNVKLNGINRRSPTNSTATLTVVGQAGTVITNGIAIDSLEQQWELPSTVTIPDAGTINVTGTASEEGAVQAEANTINRIYTPTLGWQTVNNSAAAVPGDPVETDAELRVRQAASTANPSLTVFDGTVGGVANLEGVTAVRGYENDTNSTDGNGIPAHSISVVVEGGDDLEICQMIALHKTPGTGTFGDVSETVYDAHGMPLIIEFQRVVPVTVLADVVISTGEGWSADYETLIKEAVAAAINEFGIGNDVLYTRLFIAAYLVGTPAYGTFDVVSVEISADPDPTTAANVDIDWDEIAVCDATTDVTVNV